MALDRRAPPASIAVRGPYPTACEIAVSGAIRPEFSTGMTAARGRRAPAFRPCQVVVPTLCLIRDPNPARRGTRRCTTGVGNCTRLTGSSS